MAVKVQAHKSLRKSGIAFIDDIPWGTHICGFFETQSDLIDILIPYFLAGLEDNEYCIWIIPESISIFAATNILREFFPGYELYSEQIEVLSDSMWYINNDSFGSFQGSRLAKKWTDKVDYALSKGYEGIRICGSTSWLEKRYWKTFMNYEAEVEREIGSLKMIALCPYQLSKCGMHEILDIVHNHQFSFVKSKHYWKIITILLSLTVLI
ncbi:MAG: MEDS domain-containing protein [bacterium]|jgi:hypothetical protein